MWNAKITAVSEIDSSGNVEVAFDILKKDAVLFSGMITRGASSSEIEQNIKAVMARLKEAQRSLIKVKVGDVITID